VFPNCENCPNQSSQNQNNVDRREQIILQSERNRGEREIENEIQKKWERDDSREFLFRDLPKNNSESDENNCVQKCPNWTKNFRGRREARLRECGVPARGVGGEVHFVKLSDGASRSPPQRTEAGEEGGNRYYPFHFIVDFNKKRCVRRINGRNRFIEEVYLVERGMPLKNNDSLNLINKEREEVEIRC